MIRLIRMGQPTDIPPLLAIPGIDGTPASVAPVMAHLADRREIIIVDYSAETNATLEGLTAEIAVTVRSELPATVDVLGQSIGTVLACQLVTSGAVPARKVVLSCTFTVLRWTLLRWVAALSRLTPTPLYRLTSPLTVALSCGPVGDGWSHPAFAATRDSDRLAAARRTAWEIGRDFGVDLVKLRTPSLILMGERDRFVPDAGREIAKLRDMFAGTAVRVDTVPGAGHIFLPSTAIAIAADKIESFLE